jgi:hypothetical protein
VHTHRLTLLRRTFRLIFCRIRKILEEAKNNLSADFEDVMNPRLDKCGGREKVGYSLNNCRRPSGVRVREKERPTAS